VFQLSAFRYSCGEGYEWVADVVHLFGGVLMSLAGGVNATTLRKGHGCLGIPQMWTEGGSA
jgi:hypothetical protein